MTGGIINHLWQSTVFLFAAALAAFALRRNQASVRHAVWLAASLKFLVPFSLLIWLGGALAWRSTPAPAPSVAPAIIETVQTITEPFAEVSAVPGRADVAQSPTGIPWPTVLGSVWIGGCLLVIAIRIRGWLKVRNALRASTPTTLSGVEKNLDVRATPGLLEPGIVGIWRPVLLLPVGLESTLSADQLHTVVAHEMHHIRRRDNLTSALHMIVEVLCWFHPLVWWVGARLIDERERACDEHVLASGAEPDAYAEGILNVCKRYVELPVACVSGVTGSDLKKRINAILAGQVGLALSGARKAVLVLAAVTALVVPVAAGMLTAPLRTSTQASGPPAKFEAVSVRPCDATSNAPTPGAGRSGLAGAASPGRLNFPCRDLLSLIRLAYGLYANGRVNTVSERPVFPQPSDMPDWIWRDHFTIEAKAEGEPPALVMLGPMLQDVLEHQFKLKVHRETRQVPVYELVVAKSGSKLTPATLGGCVPYDFSVSPQPSLAAGQHRCDNHNERNADGDYVYIAEMTTVDDFFLSWGDRYGRPIVNKTRITGPVAIRFVQPTHASGPDDEMASLVAAMKNQLGLELRAGKDPIEFFVIDHAERPDSAEAAASASSRQAPASLSASAAPTANTQKFEVASIKPCEPGPVAPGARSGGGGSGSFSPGRVHLDCFVVKNLIDTAYVTNRDARNTNDLINAWPGLGLAPQSDGPQRIRGGPAWVYSDKYTIEAKMPGPAPAGPDGPRSAARAAMLGPMLRALLEERFQLKLHQDTEEAPMFALTVAKGGLKITPMKDGDCTMDRLKPPVLLSEAARSGVKPTCGTVHGGPDGPNWRTEHGGQDLGVVAMMLSSDLGVKVVDRTGVTDKFNISWEYGPDESTPGSVRWLERYGPQPPAPPTAPPVFTALEQQLGLTLVPIKGPRAYLVIDRIERPTPDVPDILQPPARAAGAGRTGGE